MRRREFIAGLASTSAWPLGARAQRSDKVFRVGSLYMADAFRRFGFDQAFISGMHELGYVEGQNIVYDTLHAAGDRTRLPALVDELILLKPDVLATGEPIVPVVLSKTSTIPIVMFYSSDPVAAGLVKSLSHPRRKRNRCLHAVGGVTTQANRTSARDAPEASPSWPPPRYESAIHEIGGATRA